MAQIQKNKQEFKNNSINYKNKSNKDTKNSKTWKNIDKNCMKVDKSRNSSKDSLESLNLDRRSYRKFKII